MLAKLKNTQENAEVKEKIRSSPLVWGESAYRSTVTEKIFGSIIVTTLCCTRCENYRHVFGTSLSLSVGIPRNQKAPDVFIVSPPQGTEDKGPSSSQPKKKKCTKRQQRVSSKKNKQQRKQERDRKGRYDSDEDTTQIFVHSSDEENTKRNSHKQLMLCSSTSSEEQDSLTETFHNHSLNDLDQNIPSQIESDRQDIESPILAESIDSDSSFIASTGDVEDNNEASSSASDNSHTIEEEDPKISNFSCSPPAEQSDEQVDDEERSLAYQWASIPIHEEENSSTKGDSVDLLDCLKWYMKEEIIQGLKCPSCSKNNEKPVMTEHRKRDLFLSPANALVIHVKRFEVCGRKNAVKLNQKLSFPVDLDLSSCCSKLCPMPSGVKYRLYALVQHSGNMQSGHYISYVAVGAERKSRNAMQQRLPWPLSSEYLIQMFRRCHSSNKSSSPVESIDSRKWFRCNDSHVSQASLDEVLSAQAYLLFYELI
ncbi:Ubiquitin carboxyl-terminal hydrolase 16 [Cichlidogyrus casuarinus]|uniref:ubiquitinyl hydrolase 1 n=1 Tax=Cichlidogyrus casuarinus TaxID=1844966 RepID=A0ABD2QMC3_9PLAT